MYCSNCGNELNGSEGYCPKCGKSLSNKFDFRVNAQKFHVPEKCQNPKDILKIAIILFAIGIICPLILQSIYVKELLVEESYTKTISFGLFCVAIFCASGIVARKSIVQLNRNAKEEGNVVILITTLSGLSYYVFTVISVALSKVGFLSEYVDDEVKITRIVSGILFVLLLVCLCRIFYRIFAGFNSRTVNNQTSASYFYNDTHSDLSNNTNDTDINRN